MQFCEKGIHFATLQAITGLCCLLALWLEIVAVYTVSALCFILL